MPGSHQYSMKHVCFTFLADLLARLAQLLLGGENVGLGDSAEPKERKQPVIDLSLQGIADRMKEIGQRDSAGEDTTGCDVKTNRI